MICVSAEVLRRLRAAQHADRLLAAADLGAAAGGVEVQRAQLLVNLDRGDAERLHARRIELDADLAADAAAARHLRDAGDVEQALGDRVVDEPGELLRGERGGADRVIGDRVAVDVHPLDERLLDALRQIDAHLGDRVAHVGDGAIDGRADLELDEDVDLALDDPGGDVVDVADAGDGALDLLRDLRLDLRRRGAGLRDR